MPDKEECTRCITKVSWIGLWDSLFLALFKGIIGILTRSRALTASALYSFHDVISGVAVIIGLKVATRPLDEEHPYGYGNAEYIVCVFTSIIILGATVFLMADCIRILFRGEHAPPYWAVLGTAVVSVFINEIIYRYNVCAVKHTNSPAIEAHGKHHRADAISSVAVVAAIIGAKIGYHFLDALVAVFEAGHLILVGTEILHEGGSGLIDRAIRERDVSLIRQTLFDVPDVKEIRDIKTRQVGTTVWIDLYVALPEEKTIAEVDVISGRIRQGIERKINYLGNVNVICVKNGSPTLY